MTKLKEPSKYTMRLASGKPTFLTELQQQSRLMSWIEDSAAMQDDPEIAEILRWIHAIPNGHNRNHIWRTIARLEGVKAGVSDTFTACPSRGYHGYYIEMKRRGETPTPQQVKFGEFVKRRGYKFDVFDNWTLAAKSLVWYLALTKYAPIPDFTEDDTALQKRAQAKEVVKTYKEAQKLAKKKISASRKNSLAL